MVNELQNETMVAEGTGIEVTESGALAELSESDLDQVSGGSGLANLGSFFGSSTSGFSQHETTFGQMTFAGPNGAGSMKFFSDKGVSSFAQEIFGGSK
ncbi:MAG: CTB family bacteriocin [Synechococcales bacterium]|nr:CTB family bacteriocin [Synechococcales bacterium]